MTIKLSTGLRNAVLDTGSVRSELNGGYLHIYSGTPPASADIGKESGNTLLATIYNNGTPGAGAGLGFEVAAVAGELSKASAETWDNTNVAGGGNFASGTATYFLFVASTESDGNTITTSTTAPRIMGSVGTSANNNDLVLSSVDLTMDVPQTISSFFISIPE